MCAPKITFLECPSTPEENEIRRTRLLIVTAYEQLRGLQLTREERESFQRRLEEASMLLEASVVHPLYM